MGSATSIAPRRPPARSRRPRREGRPVRCGAWRRRRCRSSPGPPRCRPRPALLRGELPAAAGEGQGAPDDRYQCPDRFHQPTIDFGSGDGLEGAHAHKRPDARHDVEDRLQAGQEDDLIGGRHGAYPFFLPRSSPTPGTTSLLWECMCVSRAKLQVRSSPPEWVRNVLARIIHEWGDSGAPLWYGCGADPIPTQEVPACPSLPQPAIRFAVPAALPLEASFDGGRLTS